MILISYPHRLGDIKDVHRKIKGLRKTLTPTARHARKMKKLKKQKGCALKNDAYIFEKHFMLVDQYQSGKYNTNVERYETIDYNVADAPELLSILLKHITTNSEDAVQFRINTFTTSSEVPH